MKQHRIAQPPRNPGRAGGFTLLEVVVALAILSIGILAVARIFPGAKLVIEHAQQRTAAQTLAEKILRYYQTHPGELPDAFRPAIGWLTVAQLNSTCADPSTKPTDGEQGFATTCGAVGAPNTSSVELSDRVVGEGHRIDGSYPGFVMLGFAPYATGPPNATHGEPDIRSVRAYVDVPLTPPPAGTTMTLPVVPALAASPMTFDYRFIPADGPGVVNDNHAGVVIVDNATPLLAQSYADLVITVNPSNPVSPLAYRVFKCSYQWSDVNGVVHQVNDERHYDTAIRTSGLLGTQPWRFRLQIPNSGVLVSDGAPTFGGTFFAQPSSLRIVEEVDVSYRLGLTGLNPNAVPSDSSTGRLNFYAGPVAMGALWGGVTPSPAISGLPTGTTVKFDHTVAAAQNKHFRTMLETAEVPTSGVLKLPIRPLLQSDDPTNSPTVRLVDLGSGQFLVRNDTWTPTSGALTAGDYGVDYEKGELTFNLNQRPAKTPIRVAYLPAQDWIVQVQRAAETYVPNWGAVPSLLGSPAGLTMLPFAGAHNTYREFAANEGNAIPNASVNAPPLNVLGFHRSEVGKQVNVDYLDSFGVTVSGEVHTITVAANPEFGADFPAEVRLARNYTRILKVAGVSVKVRVLWGEKNNYREVAVSGTVGVEK